MSTNLVIGYGNVGKLVTAELLARGEKVVVALHRPLSIKGVTSVTMDSLDAASVEAGLKGVQRVFMTVGLEYKLKVWQRDWPVIIDNLIAGASANGSKIVFFDNIYLYGPSPLQNPITEEHPRVPPSKKGKVRLALVEKLEAAMHSGNQVLIVRSADFYGPEVDASGINMAIEAMLKGKAGYYLGDPSKLHSFSYVPDAARATVELALAADTYNQSWHLPTAPAITGKAMSDLAQTIVGTGSWRAMNRRTMSVMRFIVPILGELTEMMYQFEHDYVLSDAKFRARFPQFSVTPYATGLEATVAAERAKAPRG